MHPLGFGVIILSCIVLAGIGEIADAEDVFFFFSGHEDMNETHEAYIGEYELWTCVILEENATELRYSIQSTPMLNLHWERYYPFGTLNATDPWVLETYNGIQLAYEAPAGEYILHITLTYKNEREELVVREFEYPFEYLQALDVRSYTLYRGVNYRIELDVETFVYLDRINVSFSYPEAADGWTTIQMTEVNPGVHRFRVTFGGDMYSEIEMLDYGFMIEAWTAGHEIFLIDMQFDVRLEIVDEPQSFLLVILGVAILAISAVLVGLRLSRSRKETQDEKDLPPSD
jgi:hypothetical protein